MKKAASLIFVLVIVFALMFMGIMEKTLSGIGGNKATIILYVIVGIILLIFYLRARKQAAEEAEQNEQFEDYPEEFTEEELNSDEPDFCDMPYSKSKPNNAATKSKR